MKLVGIAMVKNEDDVIEAFVRHNLRLLDAMAILDNGSMDGTREILSCLAREGLPVCVIDYPEVRRIQSESMTNLLRSTLSAFCPDWIIPIDADEFLVEGGERDLRAHLQGHPAGCLAQIPWRTYVPAEGDDPAEANPVRRLRHRRVEEPRRWYKVALPGKVAQDPRVIIDQGNHSASLKGRNKRMRAQPLSDVVLAHFPVRSGEQILGKVMVGWLAYLCDPARSQALGYHWREMYERFLKDETVGLQDLRELGAGYAGGSADAPLVEDPIVWHGDNLSYLSLRLGSPLRRVCRMGEDLARRLADATREGLSSGTGRDLEPGEGVPSPLDLVHRSCDVPPFRYLFERFCPSSVLHVGCGRGLLLKRFLDWGAGAVTGIDRRELLRRGVVPEAVRAADPARPFDLGSQFDLSICVAEGRSPAAGGPNATIESVASHTRGIVAFCPLSSEATAGGISTDGLRGWIECWAERGFSVLPFPSLAFRLLSNLAPYRSGALVFAKKERAGVISAHDPFGVEDVVRTPRNPGSAGWRSQVFGTYERTLIGSQIERSFRSAHHIAAGDRDSGAGNVLRRFLARLS